MFSEYCATPFEVEAAEVVDPEGKTVVYPGLNYRTEKISKSKVNKLVGKRILLSFRIGQSHCGPTDSKIVRLALV